MLTLKPEIVTRVILHPDGTSTCKTISGNEIDNWWEWYKAEAKRQFPDSFIIE